MSTAAYALVWTRWYTSNMSNAILPYKLAVLAVAIDSTLVYYNTVVTAYDLYTTQTSTTYRRNGT